MVAIFDQWRREDMGEIFIQQFEITLASSLGNKDIICVHAPTCGNNIAVEHDGSVFSCDHFVYPEFKLGNINEQSYGELLAGEQLVKFGRDKLDKLTSLCVNCEVRDLCHGGCPADRLVRIEGEADPHQYLCAGYKQYFNHVRPYFEKMGECLKNGWPIQSYVHLMADELKSH